MKNIFSGFLALVIILASLNIVHADDFKSEKSITKLKLPYDQFLIQRGKPNRVDVEGKNKWLSYMSPDYKNYELYYFKDNILSSIYISKKDLLKDPKITSNLKPAQVDALVGKYKTSKLGNKYTMDGQNYRFFYDIYGLNNIFGMEISQDNLGSTRLSPSNNLSAIYEKQLLDLTNVFRAQNNKPILLPLPKLDTMAKTHAVDMRVNKYLSVLDSQGLGADQRLGQYDLRFKNLGENVGNMGHNAIELNKYFLQSKQHRENILSNDYKNIGTGICTRGEELYCSQVFFEDLN